MLIFFGILLFCFAAALTLLSAGQSGSRVAEGPQIGVVEVKGVITASRRTLEALRAFAKDDDIKAVVMRLNTPGGSVGPSQEVYREIERLRAKKPVVASMGSVAASGGYYIAAACTQIVANAGSLTGSIGVISQTTEVYELLALARIKAHVFKSGALKDTGSPLRPMTEVDRIALQKMVDEIHGQFVSDISKGRKMSLAKVKAVADGRILTGAQAKVHGLVDSLGNFSDALDVAVKLAKAEGDPVPVYHRARKGLLRQLLEDSADVAMQKVRQELETSLRIEARDTRLR
ncbi:MAG: signal peptide peptidase SppA [Deltaproteobacteria bacterium]|nr:signal peptide peptidase SppA [Deltaproteobacteria bacterium]